ncbi:hypothetical protein MAMMFC1_00360 [Methylomusa anaerophila]|uniref:Uncharacterized protein n=1 Tax=Methylomusa anaerophila TaxID=1930071 RepID=A0A348AF78_9FIRM|nr:hypothetical protein MAMMFC1_00360 [Methylomusa anaerophila]
MMQQDERLYNKLVRDNIPDIILFFHHPQILPHPVLFLLPVDEIEMRRYRQCYRVEQIAHHINRCPNIGIITTGIGRSVLRVELRWQILLKILAVLASREIEAMLYADVPFNHIMQLGANHLVQHVHDVRKFIPRDTFCYVVEAPPEVIAAGVKKRVARAA